GGGDGRARPCVLPMGAVTDPAMSATMISGPRSEILGVAADGAPSHDAPPQAGAALRSRPRTTRRGWRWEGSRRASVGRRLYPPGPLPSASLDEWRKRE